MKKIGLGRSADNDLVYATPEVSARHAELVWDGTSFWLRDLGSSNGTFVNGRRITGLTRVAADDRITLGHTAVVDFAAAQALLSARSAPQRITIGRAADNTLVLADPHVSSHHAVLERQGTAWIIRDVQSTNGTYVNDERVTGECVLARGATVRFGAHGPARIFPEEFGIALDDAPHAAEELHKPGAPAALPASATAMLPLLSSRTHLWHTPYVWVGFIVLVVMCLLFSYTGNPIAYNSYIYLFGLFSCATVLWFVYRVCGKRQPWWYLVVPAVFTAVMTIPIIMLVYVLIPSSTAEIEGFVPRLVHEIVITGLTEEFTKIVPVLLIIAHMQMSAGAHTSFTIREPLDSILLAASSAIGFVVLETIFSYCNPEHVRTDYQAWSALQLLIPRIFASVGGHVAYSGYFGYFIGLGMQHKQHFWRYAAIGYICAAVCHGLWNSIAPYGPLFMILTSSVAYFLFMAAILRARATSHSALRKTVYGAV